MSRFKDWYSRYPIKKGRMKAEQAWNKYNLDSRADELIAILKEQKAHDAQWKAGIGIPHPTTYLNQQRWEDEILRQDAKIKLPYENADLESFARQNSLSLPKRGEQFYEYRGRLKAELERLH